jgi:Glycosyltransferase family 87
MRSSSAVKFPATVTARASSIAWLILIAGVVVLAITTFKHRDRFSQVSMSEFYAWSSELRAGGDPWMAANDPSFKPLPGIKHLGHCNYPPAFLLAFEPLTMLPRQTAYWIWQAMIIASLVAATIITVREIAPSGPDRDALAVGAVLLFPEVYGALYESQPTPILLLLAVAAFSLDRRGRNAAAGLALAAAALLKMYPALGAGYFLARQRWATLAWAAFFGLAGLVATGVHSIGDFAHFGILSSSWLSTDAWLRNDRSIAVLSNVRVVIDAMFGSAPSPAGLHLWLAVTAIVDLVIVAAAAAITLRARRERALDVACYGLWLAAAIIVSPISWGHYLPFAIPLLLGICAIIGRGDGVSDVAAIAFALGVIGTILPYFSGGMRQMHMLFFATIVFYFAGCAIIAGANPANAEPA